MTTRPIPIIIAAITLAACSPQGQQTASYVYPDYWGAAPGQAARPATPAITDTIATNHDIPGSVAVFGTHTAPSAGIWLFPPNPYQ